MATWIDFTRTNQGLALDAKLTGGTTPLRITKAMSASGKVSYMKLKEQTELTNPVQTLSILEKQHGEDNTSFVLPIKLLNTGLTTKYNMYQLGIFAEDPDLGEILYMICQTSTESGEEIPTEADQPGFSIQWNHKIQIADATNVEVSVTEVGTLTQEEAAVTYLRIDDATSKYLSKTDAAATYATAEEVSAMGESLAADYATKEYVDVNGGKIDTISVNGTKQAIDADKNVELTMPTKVSELENDEEYGKAADLATHTVDTENPHAVTKTQVGLGNVDNTQDADKPVSTLQAAAIEEAKKAGIDAQADLITHASNTIAHIAAAERTAWNAKADKTYTDSQDAAKLEESKEYARSLISALVDGAPETADTLKELAVAIGSNKELIDVLNAAIGTKVDKVAGKGLSTNDYTTDEKQKLALALTSHQDISGKADKATTLAGYGITDAYTKTEISNTYASKEYVGTNGGKIDSISVNGTKQEIDELKNVDLDIPTKVSEIENDEGYGKASDLASHMGDYGNPHRVTKADVGLSNVDNTADTDKPVSTEMQKALDGKVEKESGKGLSSNDFTAAYKAKLDNAPEDINSEILLSSANKTRYGLGETGTMDQALGQNVQILTAVVPAGGWSSTMTNGWYTNRVNVSAMKAVYNPLLDLVITSAVKAEDERAAFGLIMEAETFDGYVVFRALDVPDIDFNVRFVGV